MVKAREFTEEEKQFIIEKRNEGIGCEKIGAMLNPKCSETPIVRLMLSLGMELNNIHPRKYKYNKEFFKKIDTEEKAYWLGFLYADGNIHRNTVKIRLCSKDISHLEKFNKSLENSTPIKTFKQDAWGTEVDVSDAILNSKEMCEDLIKLGCFRKKSLVLKFPTEEQVPNYLIHHFIRGYFDGDGSLYYTLVKNKNDYKAYHVSFLGTKDMLKGIKDFLKADCKIMINKRSNKIYEYKFGGNLQVLEQMDKLYENATIFLDRKYNKYIELKNSYTEELKNSRKNLSSRFR